MLKKNGSFMNENHLMTYPSRVIIDYSDNAVEREAMRKCIDFILQYEDNLVIEWMRYTDKGNESPLEEKGDFVKITSDGSVFWSISEERNLNKIGHLNEAGQIILHEGICLL